MEIHLRCRFRQEKIAQGGRNKDGLGVLGTPWSIRGSMLVEVCKSRITGVIKCENLFVLPVQQKTIRF